MSDTLCISQAANLSPDAIALVTIHRSFTFRELAVLVRSRKETEVLLWPASSELATAIEFYSALETQRCIVPVNPNLDPDEQKALAKRIPQNRTNTALILFTSGSDGIPKGVMLSRSALIASANASRNRLGWVGDDRWLCALPLWHIGGLSILSRCLQSRKTVVLADTFDAHDVARSIVRDRITHLSLVPTMLWRLLEIGFHAPDHLAHTLIGGAAIDPALLVRAENAGFYLHVSYGMTECASQVITDGLPLSGVDVCVRDHGLEVRGPILMNGYIPPHDSAETLCEGWFRTGDRARIHSDGHVEILGRLDDIIISGGENISPHEIETALLSYPEIEATYVFGIPHSEWGQELTALIVSNVPIAQIDFSSDKRLLGHRKPKNMITVDSLPLLANGKIDRQQALLIAQIYQRK